jgi:hypothetical protein
MSTEFVLPASLFSGEPVERDVVLNQTSIDEATAKQAKDAEVHIPEPQIITFLLLPVTSALDVKYTKERGHNENRFRFTPKRGEAGENETKFEPMERIVSNERELKALTMIAKEVIKGWLTFKNSEGQDVVFSEHNLERLCGYSYLIEPAVREAYEIASIKDGAESGNSETSFVGSANPNEDQNGGPTGEIAELTK